MDAPLIFKIKAVAFETYWFQWSSVSLCLVLSTFCHVFINFCYHLVIRQQLFVKDLAASKQITRYNKNALLTKTFVRWFSCPVPCLQVITSSSSLSLFLIHISLCISNRLLVCFNMRKTYFLCFDMFLCLQNPLNLYV